MKKRKKKEMVKLALSVDYGYIRSVANELLKGVESPPVPIYEITRSIVPVVFTLERCVRDAVCFRSRKGEYRIFIGLAGSTPERVRFSTAHELAHILLEHHVRLENVARRMKIEVPANWMVLWNEIRELAPLVYLYDKEANAFAAEILMPVKWLTRPKTLDEFESLRKKLFVSAPALRRRLVETGIMTACELNALFRKANKIS